MLCRTPLHCFWLGVDPRARHTTAEDAERTQEDVDGNKLPALVVSSLNVLPRARARGTGCKAGKAYCQSISRDDPDQKARAAPWRRPTKRKPGANRSASSPLNIFHTDTHTHTH